MIRRWKANEKQLRLIKNKDKKYLKKIKGGIKRTKTESQEKDIWNYIKECGEKKAIGTNSLVCSAGKLNPNFEEKTSTY